MVAVGIALLSTAHGLLGEAERVQAEQVGGPPRPTLAAPVTMVPVAGSATASYRSSSGVILAAIDGSPVAALVTEAAARLAAASGRTVHVVHAQEGAAAGDMGIDVEDADSARAVVGRQLEQLAAHHVPAEGQILLHASDHGTAGRLVAEYANTIGATTIVTGAPTHGGLPALMDASASQELWRHARSNIVIVNPAVPLAPRPRPGGGGQRAAGSMGLSGYYRPAWSGTCAGVGAHTRA